ncbi:MAG: cytochrome c-type biogenesis protein CcmH [Deltaproteobacteria bacterium]|nr:cytochrome c-type biogenesis protein CcmH [Deltaproteobacteria bacterium]
MHIKSKKLTIVFLMFASIFLLAPAEGFSASATEITQGLACFCGCNMVVSACKASMECGTADMITKEVEKMVADGKTRDEIIQFNIAKYGEKILAAPSKKGFNFLAWVLPFLGLAVGVGGIFIFIDRSLGPSREKEEVAEKPAETSENDKKYREQFESELDSYEI